MTTEKATKGVAYLDERGQLLLLLKSNQQSPAIPENRGIQKMEIHFFR